MSLFEKSFLWFASLTGWVVFLGVLFSSWGYPLLAYLVTLIK